MILKVLTGPCGKALPRQRKRDLIDHIAAISTCTSRQATQEDKEIMQGTKIDLCIGGEA